MSAYKYIVVPKDGYSNEIIGKFLLETSKLDGNEVTFNFKKVEQRGYYVEHSFITRLKKSTDRNLKYLLFSQQGTGAIREYGIPGKKKSAVQKKVAEDLAKLRERKKV